MPKLSKSARLSQLSGTLGTVVFRELYGETIVQNKPDKKKKPTAHQEQSGMRFKRASRWAKRISNNPETKGLYEAKVAGSISNAYTVAMKDYLNPPEVIAIFTHNYTGQPGSKIVVEATDDFKVKSVELKILDQQERIIEVGEATNIHGNKMWYYITTVENKNLPNTKIIATAKDNPGNDGTLEKVL